MTRWFNIAGACDPQRHYVIPPERRLVEARALLDEGRFFTLVSGRQTGKTTSVLWLLDHINADGRRCALWVDVQTAREQPDPRLAFRTILGAWDRALARDLPELARPTEEQVERWLRDPASALIEFMRFVCVSAPRPVVVFFDEADCLVGATMVSFLTQLREIYLTRGRAPGPHAIALVGVRSVRDYVLSVDERRHVAWLGTASPFNVTAENVGLAAFTAAEVAELAAQHTADTGQRFEDEAVAKVFTLSAGHPWLVNALCDQCTRRDVTDRAVAVTAAHVESAKETIILERRTHIDSLLAKLREDRVRRVIDPMIAGATVPASQLDDDIAYVLGLGLCRVIEGRCEAANPIYREVIVRTLTYGTQLSLDQKTAWYVGDDGALDVAKLLAGWQAFWREDGHLAAEGFSYKESGPHLMLMAFLQRVVNGGGRIEREYALGKGAIDLLVTWRGARHVIELKQRRDTNTLAKGVAQVAAYARSLGLKEAWLVLFDRRKSVPWGKRVFTRKRTSEGVTVRVVGC